MIRKTLRKNIRRELRSSFSRFAAIFAITALGAGFFAGLKGTSPDMRATADFYYNDQRLMDYRLVSTMGFTEEDVAALEAREDVQQVMATHGLDVLVDNPEGVEAVRLHALPSDTSEDNPAYLNRPVLTSGRLPTAAGECVVDAATGYRTGDTIQLSAQNEQSTTDLLAVRSFTVVGRANSPYYISFQRGNTNIANGRIAFFLYVTQDAFDSEYYTELFVTSTETQAMSSFAPAWLDTLEKGEDELEVFALQRAQIRYDDIYTEATAELADARSELANGRTEADEKLADAWQEIEDGEQELADGRAQLEEKRRELNDGRQQLDDARAQLESGRSALDAAQATADAGAAELAVAREQIAQNEQVLADAKAGIDMGEAALAPVLAQLEQGEADYNAGLATYTANREAYDNASAQLAALSGQMDTLDVTTAQLGVWLAEMNGGDMSNEMAFRQTATATLAGLQEMLAAMQVAGLDTAALESAMADATTALGNNDYAGVYTALGSISAPIRAMLAGAQGALDAALPALDDAKTQLDAARATLDTGWAGYTPQRQALDDATQQYEAGMAQLNAAKQTLAEGEAAYTEGSVILAEKGRELAAGEATLAENEAKLNDGARQLADAETELADAEQTLADGKEEYNTQKADAEKELDDAQTEIDDAAAELDDLDPPEWFVFTRQNNPGYSGFASDVDRINAIAAVIPVFFYLVAALVCLTTMTRMVEEQRTLIGTLKALGFSRYAIAFKFVVYAGVASLAGAVAGVFAGFYLFPTTIWNAYGIMYIMPSLHYSPNLGIAAVSVFTSVLCTVAATLAACFSELRSVPAELMRPKAPKAGKRVVLERIPILWNHMKFSQKVTARNLFRYKKRFFMTIVGVAGCTALLLTGFGLRDSITGIVGKQFGDINQYDIVAALADPSTAQADTKANEVFAEYGDTLYTASALIDARRGSDNNAGMTTSLVVAEQPERLNDFINLHTRGDEEPIPFPQGDGVVITEKLAARLDAKVGDEIEINRVNETPVAVTVAGIMENYVQNYVYISPTTYEALLGDVPEYNTVYINLHDDNTLPEKDILTRIIDTPGVAGAMDIADMRAAIDDMLQSLNSVVWLIIAAAAALAFVVLYNLTNINITERAREIATLKVLGFYNGEVAGYVYRENLLLTAIGIAAGLVGGIFLHQFVIQTAEIDEVMFRRVVMPLSYLFSVLFTLLSAGLVNLVMLPRLHKIDMVESLKSAE